MVRLAGEGLRSVGVEPPSPHPRASALSCPSLAIYGPGNSLVRQPRPAPRFYSQRRTNRYSPQTMARAPPTASAASTQKSIASMHSPLSLAVGYNRESLPAVDAHVTTLWQLSRRIRLPRCSEARCRTPASILSSAALGGPILQRGPSLCTLGALRRSLSGATMTTPGGAGTLRKAL